MRNVFEGNGVSAVLLVQTTWAGRAGPAAPAGRPRPRDRPSWGGQQCWEVASPGLVHLPQPAGRPLRGVAEEPPGGTGTVGRAGWWAPWGQSSGPTPGMGSVRCVHSVACRAAGRVTYGCRRPGGGDSAAPHPPGTRLSLLTGLLTIAPRKAYLRTFGSLAIFNIKIKAFLHTCGLKNGLVSPGAGVSRCCWFRCWRVTTAPGWP